MQVVNAGANAPVFCGFQSAKFSRLVEEYGVERRRGGGHKKEIYFIITHTPPSSTGHPSVRRVFDATEGNFTLWNNFIITNKFQSAVIPEKAGIQFLQMQKLASQTSPLRWRRGGRERGRGSGPYPPAVPPDPFPRERGIKTHFSSNRYGGRGQL